MDIVFAHNFFGHFLGLFDQLKQVFSLFPLVLESLEEFLDDSVTDGLEGGHLVLKVFKLGGAIDFMVLEIFFRFINFPKHLLEFLDLEPGHFLRRLHIVLRDVFCDLHVGGEIDGRNLLILPDLSFPAPWKSSTARNVRDFEERVLLLFLDYVPNIEAEL
jgi:hypothetical protein